MDILITFGNLLFNIINTFLYILPFGIFDNFSGVFDFYNSDTLIGVIMIAIFMGMIFLIFLLRFFSLPIYSEETNSGGEIKSFLGETIRYVLGGTNFFYYKDIVVAYFAKLGIKIIPIFIVLLLLYVPISPGAQGYNTVGGVISENTYTIKKGLLNLVKAESSIADNLKAKQEELKDKGEIDTIKYKDVFDLKKSSDVLELIKRYDGFSYKEKLSYYTGNNNIEGDITKAKYEKEILTPIKEDLKKTTGDEKLLETSVNNLKEIIKLQNEKEGISLALFFKPSAENIDSVYDKIMNPDIVTLSQEEIEKINNDPNKVGKIKNSLINIYTASKGSVYNSDIDKEISGVLNLQDKNFADLETDNEKRRQAIAIVEAERLLYLLNNGINTIYDEIQSDFTLFNGAIIYSGPNLSKEFKTGMQIIAVLLNILYVIFLLLIAGRKNLVIMYIHIAGEIHKKLFDNKYGDNPLFSVKAKLRDNGIDLKELEFMEEEGNEAEKYIILTLEVFIRLILIFLLIYG